MRGGVYRNCEFIFLGNNNAIELGKGCTARDGSFYTQDDSNAILVGDNTVFAGKIHIACTEASKCVIGRDCLFSSEIVIRSGDSHSIFDENGVRINPAEDIIIGDHVWVGYRALVTKGAVIPNNCVVGTGSVVTRKTEKSSHVVLAGVPARHVKEHIDWCYERV